MSKQPDPDPIPLADDDQLLANAIPIEDLEQEDSTPGTPPRTPPAPGSAPGKPVNLANLGKTGTHESAVPAPIELDESAAPSGREIRTFDTRRRHQEKWQRKPNATGQGAIHVKTFVAKLRLDAIEHMDEQINQWLDQNPEYEVKMINSSVGILTGKLREEALFVSVWV